MKKSLLVIAAMLLTAGLIIPWGCSDNSNNALDNFQPEISDTTDNFQFQVTDAVNVSTTVNYDWENTGARASVNQSCAITGGSAQLQIFDALDSLVYDRSLADNGTFQSDTAGVAGTWNVRVILNNLSGTLNFRAEKM